MLLSNVFILLMTITHLSLLNIEELFTMEMTRITSNLMLNTRSVISSLDHWIFYTRLSFYKNADTVKYNFLLDKIPVNQLWGNSLLGFAAASCREQR